MNPVRANMTLTPDDYSWSSYACHAWGEANALIDDHVMYQALGHTEEERQHTYRELFKIDLPEQDIHQIGQATHYNYLLENTRFRDQIEAVLQRKVGYDKRGRPPQVTG